MLLFYMVSCRSQQQFYQKYDGIKLAVGTSGGFTGEEKKFVLLDNGNLYKISSLSHDTVFVAKLENAKSKQIFNNYNVLGLGKMNISEPGNMNYFIEYKNGDISHKLLWSNSLQKGSEVHLFYDFFMEIVRSLTNN